MGEKKIESQQEDAQFRRRLKYAMLAFALVEFIVTALIIYHKARG